MPSAWSGPPLVLLAWASHGAAALITVLPALLVLVLVDRYDARGDEPRWLLRRAAATGAFAVVPALGLELALAFAGLPVRGTEAASIAASSLVVVALPEEACKAIALLWLSSRRLVFEHRRDGLRYGARIGLGFAVVENLFYGLLLPEGQPLALTMVARTVLTVPMHAVWAAMIGDGLAQGHFDRRRFAIVRGLGLAIAGHGLFDFGLAIAHLARARGDTAGFAAAIALVLATAAAGALFVRRRARAALLRDAEDEADAQR